MKSREIHGLLWCALGVLVLAALPAPGSAQTGVVDGCLSSSSCWTGAIIICPT